MTLTKESLAKVTGIKIELDHFSYTIINGNISSTTPVGETTTDPKSFELLLKLVKTSEYKKAIGIHGETEALASIDSKFFKVITIKLNDIEGEKIFLESSIKNLTEKLLRIIQVLKQK